MKIPTSLNSELSEVNASVSNKAPKSHAVNGTTYGLGTDTNYGHVRVYNNVTRSAYYAGESLGAYQGYLLANRISALEGNFNTALTSLYNTCVDKGSTPTNQTISAIVTAVQNISSGKSDNESFPTYGGIITQNELTRDTFYIWDKPTSNYDTIDFHIEITKLGYSFFDVGSYFNL